MNPQQPRLPDTTRRAIPAGPIRRASTKPRLESVDAERNLFNADTRDAADAIAASQGDLFA